jgi:hypothetical protein
MTTSQGPDRRPREPRTLGRLAWGLCVAAEGIAVACVVLLAGHVGLGDAVNAYLVTNLGMVVTFAASGGLVAGNRPEHPIGWLFLGSSACFALATPAGTVAVTQQATLPLGSPRALLVLLIGPYPLGIGIALQLVPTGHPQPALALADRADRGQRAGLRRPDDAGPGRMDGDRPSGAPAGPPGRPPPPPTRWGRWRPAAGGVLAASVAGLMLGFRRPRGWSGCS